MMNVNPSIVRVGVVSLLLLVVTAGLAVDFNRHKNPPLAPARPPARQEQAAPTAIATAATPAPPAAPSIPPVVTVTFAPLPADATVIPDDYLLKLSGMVNLANARDETPDKAQWRQATTVAEHLQAGPCDCEQRNWLHHFVEMGTAVESDDKFRYYELADLMRTLGRNDAQAMALSHQPK